MHPQAFLLAHTGLTELPYLAAIQVTPGYADHGPSVTLIHARQYTLQAQEDSYLFDLTEPFWDEAMDLAFAGDDAEPPEWDHDDTPPPQPCPQDSPWWPYTATHYTLAEATFSNLPEGAWFHDPLSNLDMVKTGPSHARARPASPFVYWFDQTDRTLI